MSGVRKFVGVLGVGWLLVQMATAAPPVIFGELTHRTLDELEIWVREKAMEIHETRLRVNYLQEELRTNPGQRGVILKRELARSRNHLAKVEKEFLDRRTAVTVEKKKRTAPLASDDDIRTQTDGYLKGLLMGAQSQLQATRRSQEVPAQEKKEIENLYSKFIASVEKEQKRRVLARAQAPKKISCMVTYRLDGGQISAPVLWDVNSGDKATRYFPDRRTAKRTGDCGPTFAATWDHTDAGRTQLLVSALPLDSSYVPEGSACKQREEQSTSEDKQRFYAMEFPVDAGELTPAKPFVLSRGDDLIRLECTTDKTTTKKVVGTAVIGTITTGTSELSKKLEGLNVRPVYDKNGKAVTLDCSQPENKELCRTREVRPSEPAPKEIRSIPAGR